MPEVTERNLDKHVESFKSITDFVRTLDQRQTHDGWGSCDSHENGNVEFYGTESYKQAIDGIEGGDEHAYQIMQRYLRDMTASYSFASTKPLPRNYFCGGSPNVVRAMMGLPRDMRQLHREPIKTKMVEFVYDIAVHCGVSVETMCQRGAKMLAIIAMLEADGYRVKLTSVEHTRDAYGDVSDCEDTEYGWAIPLKGYRDIIDMRKLAFPLANAAFHRRIGFRYMETCPKYTRSGHMSRYGRCREGDEESIVRAWRARAATVRENGGNMFFVNGFDLDEIEPLSWLKDNGFID